MREGDLPEPTEPKPPLGLMGWIAGYKLIKAAIAVLAGIGAFNLRHHDLSLLAARWVQYFDLDPNGRLVTSVLAHLLRLNDNRLRFLGVGFFVYAALYTVEGIGLFLEERWAEWLTIVQTSLLVPLEVRALILRPSLLHVSILAFNLAMIGYLLWRLQKDKPHERPPPSVS